MASQISIEDQIAEVDRELKLREIVYPRWVNASKPKLTPATADRQLSRLRAVRESLLELQRLRAVPPA